MRRALRFLIGYIAALALLIPHAFGQVAPDYSKTRGGKVATLLCAGFVAVSTTGDTNENTLATCNVPGGAMGLNGGLLIYSTVSGTNSANNKTFRIRFGGIGGTAYFAPVFTTANNISDLRKIRNRNSASSQIGAFSTSLVGLGASGLAPVTSSINTALDQALVFTGQLASAAETITLESYEVWLLP